MRSKTKVNKKYFRTVRQFNRVLSLRHLTIEHGKEHRATDCEYKLVSWDHLLFSISTKRHWDNKFHIAQKNSSLKIEVVLSTTVESFFCQISSIGIIVVFSQYSVGLISHTVGTWFQAPARRKLCLLFVKREGENCWLMLNWMMQLISIRKSNRPKHLAAYLLKVFSFFCLPF